MKRLKQALSLNSGDHHAYDGSLRDRELTTRLRWFLTLRWLWMAGCFLLAALNAVFPVLKVNYLVLLAVAVFLGLTNVVYSRLSKSVADMRRMRSLVITQTLTDYLALAAVSYVLGGIETPVIFLFLAEISIVTLFCHRWVSLPLTLAGLALAILPSLLESAGILPPVSIYAPAFKQNLLANPLFIAAYLAGVGIVFLYCWYIISEIAGSLHWRETQLDEAYHKLKQMDTEKTQAMLHAAHELKAPLAAIKSFVYTLDEGYCGELPPKAQQVVGRIGKRSDLLMNKVVDIIHLSNLRTLVQPEMQLGELDLTALIAHEVEEARIPAEKRGIRIHNLFADEEDCQTCRICRIRGSRDYLHTLFSNLLQNAVNYSRDGGEVEVEIQEHPDRVTVHVRDHGIGISAENQKKIFDEHFRTHDAVTHNPNGTGLGLPIVKEIARIHHAVLRVKSELGKGSQFSVTFCRMDRIRDENTETVTTVQKVSKVSWLKF